MVYVDIAVMILAEKESHLKPMKCAPQTESSNYQKKSADEKQQNKCLISQSLKVQEIP